MYREKSVCNDDTSLLFVQAPLRLGVLCIGAPACGMNPAIRSFARLAMFEGHTVLGLHDGVEGIAEGNVHMKHYTQTFQTFFYVH